MCGVCAVERASESGAVSRGEQRAAHNPQRGPGWAAGRWVGRAASPPAGSPLVACRPPIARKPARSRGAAPEPERESPTEQTLGRTHGIRVPHSLPPCALATAPIVSSAGASDRPSTALGGTRAAAPGRRVSGRARLPGSSRAPPPAFAFAAAARRGLPGQRPGPPGRPRRGNLAAERRRRPQPCGPGGNRWRGPGRVLCVGARRPAAGGRASLGRSLPSTVPPGGRTPGRLGNGAGITRNEPLGTAWLQGGEGVATVVREPRGGAGAPPRMPVGE